MGLRCFLPPEVWHGSEIRLSGREAHHLSRVLRIHVGDSVTCFDGEGTEAEAVIAQTTSREVILQLGQQRKTLLPAWDISLGIAVPGQGKLEEIINQATQLGVSRIIPLATQRTVAQFTLEHFSRKLIHLRQVAIEVLKQCGGSRIPGLQSITPWRELLATLSGYDLVLMATVEGPHEGLRDLVVNRRPKHLLVLVGPEGDFSSEEIQQAVQAGAHQVSLGPSVLRCETAAAAVVSIVSFLLREQISP